MPESMVINSYLAHADKGVHLHALDLPGCFGRGQREKEALADLEKSVRKYIADLARHGEPVESPGSLDLRIVEHNRATGPFDPGDTAALFEIEKTPIDQNEIERYLHLARFNRADLLALVGNLPALLLDWESPAFEGFTIRKILRHIGNGEKWYASRILAREEEPDDWDHDAGMPIYEFLEVSRRTCHGVYRSLAPDRLDGRVLYPAHHTSNPDEPWTLRKSLRRMLEHEREHTEHIHEVIDAVKNTFRGKMIAARDAITYIAVQLSASELIARQITGTWSMREVVGHLVGWEKLALESVRKTLAGEETVMLSGFEDERIDEINAAFAAGAREKSWEEVWGDYNQARDDMLAFLSDCTAQDLARVMTAPWGSKYTLFRFFELWPEHDQEHIEMIREETDLLA